MFTKVNTNPLEKHVISIIKGCSWLLQADSSCCQSPQTEAEGEPAGSSCAVLHTRPFISLGTEAAPLVDGGDESLAYAVGAVHSENEKTGLNRHTTRPHSDHPFNKL